jgi:hypothetical protein
MRSTALSPHTCEASDLLRKWRRKLGFLALSSRPLCCTETPKSAVGWGPAGATPETCKVDVIMADDVICTPGCWKNVLARINLCKAGTCKQMPTYEPLLELCHFIQQNFYKNYILYNMQ